MACPLCGSLAATPMLEAPAQMTSGPRPSFRMVRCEACALIRLDPVPSPAELARYYGPDYLPHRGAAAWGRYARFVEIGGRGQDRARTRWARRAVLLAANARVLDVGCGRPTFLAALRRATGAACTGFDADAAAWGDPAQWPGLRLQAGSLADLPEGPFDLVTMWHALEHLPDPLGTLEALRGRVRAGGALLVEVPDYDSLTRVLHGRHWSGWSTPRHLTTFTAATLRGMLERAGWRVRRQVRHGTIDPYVLWWLGRQERGQRDLTGPLEHRMAGFVLGKILTAPLSALSHLVPMGAQIAIASPR